MNRLNHLAIIMDGHRRWAKDKGIPAIDGHTAGANKLFECCEWCIENEIKYLTVHVFSIYNWQRSKKEVDNLFSLMNKIFNEKANYFKTKGIKVKVIGEISMLDSNSKLIIEKIQDNTKKCKTLTLSLAISYGGREEIVAGFKKYIIDNNGKELNWRDLDVSNFSKYLYTSELPNVDLLIRPGGRERISNFLIWQCADAEIYFENKSWPDYERTDFQEVIEKYKNATISHGKDYDEIK